MDNQKRKLASDALLELLRGLEIGADGHVAVAEVDVVNVIDQIVIAAREPQPTEHERAVDDIRTRRSRFEE